MGAAFLITLREGLEAALVVAIVLTYLRQLGRADQFSIVLTGALAGTGVALAAGVSIYLAIGELEGSAEGYTEALIALTAASVLTWMVFWMRRQARTIGGELRRNVDRALATGAVVGLASIAFVGVLREGLETALFLLAVIFDNGAVNTTTGAISGLAVALALGYGIYRGGQSIDIKRFFQVSGGLIILVAGGLLAKGVFQLQTLGVFDSYYWPLWDITTNPMLGHGQFAAFLRGLFGWNPQPSIEQALIWTGYVATAGWLFYFGEVPAALSERLPRWTNALARALSLSAVAEADMPTRRDR